MMRLICVASTLCVSCVLHASILSYSGTLSGANENPATTSTGTGFAAVTVNTVANTIAFNVSFSGLSTADTAAHIHCCVAQGGNTAVATAMPALPGFPLGVTSGVFTGTFNLLDASFYTPTFLTNNGGTAASAEAVLLAGLAADQAYFNIHTQTDPGGEIRAFLVPTPEPVTFLLTGVAFAAFGIRRHRSSVRAR